MNSYRLMLIGILLALSARAEEDVSFGGNASLLDKRMLAITGKLQGCTGTVVSPAKGKPVMVLTASHCRKGPQLFQLVSGEKLTVTCVGNKDWAQSTGEDVML